MSLKRVCFGLFLLFCFLAQWGFAWQGEKEGRLIASLEYKEGCSKRWGYYFKLVDAKSSDPVLSKVRAKIKKEPPYKGEPRYGLLWEGGIGSSEEIIIALYQGSEPPFRILIIDVNNNGDLTDDKPVTLKEGERVELFIPRRIQTETGLQTRELPFILTFDIRKDREGKITELIFITTNYCMEGYVEVSGQQYLVRLHDSDDNGYYSKLDTKATVLLIDLDKSGEIGRGEYFWLYDLIPFEDKLYEVAVVADDGSTIIFKETAIEPIAEFQPAPDFRAETLDGKMVSLSMMSGKTILLHFWSSLCKPCVEEFKPLKSIYDQYKTKGLEVIHISLDDVDTHQSARKIIKEKDLNWGIMILTESGFYSHIAKLYQVNRLWFYILISPKGDIQKITSSIEDISNEIESLFKHP